jgi:hypothetical protein
MDYILDGSKDGMTGQEVVIGQNSIIINPKNMTLIFLPTAP